MAGSLRGVATAALLGLTGACGPAPAPGTAPTAPALPPAPVPAAPAPGARSDPGAAAPPAAAGDPLSAALPAPGDRPGFTVEPAYLVSFNAPPEAVERVMRAVLAVDPLQYGAYDQVAFRMAPGIEQFRSRPGARAGASERRADTRSQRITFALPPDPAGLGRVLDALHRAHPFEEPVIHIERGWVTRTRAGHDPANPNRWWNQPPSQAPASGR